MTRRLRLAMRSLIAIIVVVLAVLGQSGTAEATPGPKSTPEWWFDSWGVPALWASGARGAGVTIAEIDTGVNGTLPQLAGNLIPGHDFGVVGGNGYTDHDIKPFGHGTGMASIMVAQPSAATQGVTGLAPAAKVMPIALPIDGTDDAAGSGTDHLPDAIRWAADNGGKIISMSLGGVRDPSEDSAPCPTDEQDAITYAITKGVIVVAASGNDGDLGSPVEDPGVCLGVVSVGAVDRNNNVAAFSSRHAYLTTSAPGVNIPSLGRIPGKVWSGVGSSQSTAIVSASLALIWSKFPTLSGRQVVSKMLSGLDKASATRDPGLGFGIVNPAKAIQSGNPDAPNPVYEAIDPFVAKEVATTAETQAKVPAASNNTDVPGVISIGAPPSPWSSAVLGDLALALGGLILLGGLSFAGVRLRRRRAAAAQTTAEVFGFTAGGTYDSLAYAGSRDYPPPDRLSAAYTEPVPTSAAVGSAVESASTAYSTPSYSQPGYEPGNPQVGAYSASTQVAPPRPTAEARTRATLPPEVEEDAANWQEVTSADSVDRDRDRDR